MTVIKQLRPERPRAGFRFIHVNRRQMRIHRGIQTSRLWHMLAPFGADSSSLCQWGNKQWVKWCGRYFIFFEDIFRNACVCLSCVCFFKITSKKKNQISFSPAFTALYSFQTKQYLENNLSVMDCFHWSTNLRYWGVFIFFLGCLNSLSRTAARHRAAAMRYLAFSGRKKSKLALHSEITQVLKLLTALKQ